MTLINTGISWNEAEKLVEKNILEFLSSRNKKVRMYATKYFAEFIKPKKREQKIEATMTFEDWLKEEKKKDRK